MESLAFDPENHANMDLWAYLHDRVRDHEMPPPEDSLVEADERADFVEEFESLLHNVSREYIATEGRVRSRRLNRIEYESRSRIARRQHSPSRVVARRSGYARIYQHESRNFPITSYKSISKWSTSCWTNLSAEPFPRHL